MIKGIISFSVLPIFDVHARTPEYVHGRHFLTHPKKAPKHNKENNKNIEAFVQAAANTKAELQMAKNLISTEEFGQPQIQAISDWMAIPDNKKLVRFQYEKNDPKSIAHAMNKVLEESMDTFNKTIKTLFPLDDLEKIQKQIDIKAKKIIVDNNRKYGLTAKLSGSSKIRRYEKIQDKALSIATQFPTELRSDRKIVETYIYLVEARADLKMLQVLQREGTVLQRRLSAAGKDLLSRLMVKYGMGKYSETKGVSRQMNALEVKLNKTIFGINEDLKKQPMYEGGNRKKIDSLIRAQVEKVFFENRTLYKGQKSLDRLGLKKPVKRLAKGAQTLISKKDERRLALASYVKEKAVKARVRAEGKSTDTHVKLDAITVGETRALGTPQTLTIEDQRRELNNANAINAVEGMSYTRQREANKHAISQLQSLNANLSVDSLRENQAAINENNMHIEDLKSQNKELDKKIKDWTKKTADLENRISDLDKKNPELVNQAPKKRGKFESKLSTIIEQEENPARVNTKQGSKDDFSLGTAKGKLQKKSSFEAETELGGTEKEALRGKFEKMRQGLSEQKMRVNNRAAFDINKMNSWTPAKIEEQYNKYLNELPKNNQAVSGVGKKVSKDDLSLNRNIKVLLDKEKASEISPEFAGLLSKKKEESASKKMKSELSKMRRDLRTGVDEVSTVGQKKSDNVSQQQKNTYVEVLENERDRLEDLDNLDKKTKDRLKQVNEMLDDLSRNRFNFSDKENNLLSELLKNELQINNRPNANSQSTDLNQKQGTIAIPETSKPLDSRTKDYIEHFIENLNGNFGRKVSRPNGKDLVARKTEFNGSLKTDKGDLEIRIMNNGFGMVKLNQNSILFDLTKIPRFFAKGNFKDQFNAVVKQIAKVNNIGIDQSSVKAIKGNEETRKKDENAEGKNSVANQAGTHGEETAKLLEKMNAANKEVTKFSRKEESAKKDMKPAAKQSRLASLFSKVSQIKSGSTKPGTIREQEDNRRGSQASPSK